MNEYEGMGLLYVDLRILNVNTAVAVLILDEMV